ncbi:MAG: hypothetical protein ABIQ54_04835 [Gammaproteobacteria bacterium]
MEKKLLPALILSLLAGTAIADSDSSGSKLHSMSGAANDGSVSSSSDSSPSAASNTAGDTSSSNKSMSGASSSSQTADSKNLQASGGATLSVDASRLSELSADPNVALFNRLDKNRDGIINNDELSAGRDNLTLNIDTAASADSKGLDLTHFKTAITNSMLGLTAGGTSTGNMASSPSSSSAAAGTSVDGSATSASTDSNNRNVQGAGAADANAGMLDESIMRNVEKEGGPTMEQGGANPSGDTLTPEQKLNNPNAASGNTP